MPYIGRIFEEAVFGESNFLGKGAAFWSFLYFLFYTLIYNYTYFLKSLNNRLIVLCTLFISIIGIVETIHSNSVYREVTRTFLMMSAIPLYVSWILRSKSTIHYCLLSYIVYGIVNALNIVLSISLPVMLSYGNAESSRDYVLNNLIFWNDLNGVGYLMSSCLAILYFYIIDPKISPKTKLFLQSISILFFYSLLSCVSRSALLNLFLIMLVILIKNGIKLNLKNIIFVFIIPTFFLVAPKFTEDINTLLFSRFETIEIGNTESVDSRANLYTNILNEIDEVFWTGVGEGNYFGSWGENSSLSKTTYSDEKGYSTTRMSATHDSLAQILFYWGIFPVIIYVFINIQLYNMLLKGKRDSDIFRNSALILYLTSIMMILFLSNFGYKEFTLTYGLILGLHLRKKYFFD